MDIQTLQLDLQKALVEHQQLELQYQESKIVKEELDSLDESAKIYKLVGPILVEQDRAEAETNVTKRLELIGSQKHQLAEKVEKLQQEIHNTQIAMREQQIKTAIDTKA